MPSPRIDRLEVAVYTVPTQGPEADGTLRWDATTAVVVTDPARPDAPNEDSARLAPGIMDPQGFGELLTPIFSVLIVFVLAEVFREGARLRRESELTI